jgi:hypothetical protein
MSSDAQSSPWYEANERRADACAGLAELLNASEVLNHRAVLEVDPGFPVPHHNSTKSRVAVPGADWHTRRPLGGSTYEVSKIDPAVARHDCGVKVRNVNRSGLGACIGATVNLDSDGTVRCRRGEADKSHDYSPSVRGSKSLHQPSGLILPSTAVQEPSGNKNMLQSLHFSFDREGLT